MKKVKSFELIDHGIEGSQYFQGCGVWGTAFDHVVTGCGDNPREALDDALDSLNQPVDVEGLRKRIIDAEGDNPNLVINDDGEKDFPLEPSAYEHFMEANDLTMPNHEDFDSDEEYEQAVLEVENGREKLDDVADTYYYMSIRYTIETGS